MMRIVCPNCGEEPQKGQRHICSGAAAEEVPKPSPKPVRVRAPCATAGSMCASIASLATKNPALWKSKRSLARCGGDDFVAALIFMAAASPDDWCKNSKQAFLSALNLVANEAATALQRCWRRRARARDTVRNVATLEAVAGYSAKAAATHPGSFGRRRVRVPAEPAPPAAPTAPSRKSNPRPAPSRAVPVNPLQAMKLRHAQQKHGIPAVGPANAHSLANGKLVPIQNASPRQEAQERRVQGMQEAEEARSELGAER
eukprot:Skav209602  [mRNA]  locus=scaffold1634:93446:94471:- [translate_table: standard]